MTIRQLQYFLRIVELKSFSKAAVFLHVAQPALGLQIRKLEDELEVKLLHRHSRGVSPTEAGLVLRDHAMIILRQIERARLHLIDLAGPPRGKIAVGVTPTVNLVLAATLVSRCRDELPEVSITLAEAMSETLMEWVESDRLDMAFTYNPGAVPGLVCEPLLIEDLCLAGPGDDDRHFTDPVPFSDLVGLPLILPSRPHGLRVLMDEAADNNDVDLDVVLEIDSVPATKELVEKSIGYTVLPMGALYREVADGRLKAATIAAPTLSRQMYLAYFANRPESKANTAVRQIIRGAVQDGLESGAWAWRKVE